MTSTRGKLYEYLSYNTTTNKYDTAYGTWGWYQVNAGYYLADKASCGYYAYYHEVNECPDGSYCPGKTGVVCNASNAATVHTETFGLESCSALTTPSGWVSGGTFSSVSPRSANTNCRYVAPDKDKPSNCSSITKNTLEYDGTTWPVTFYTVTSEPGRYITSNNNANPNCAICAAGKYTDANNQTACQNVNAGYYSTGCGTSATGAVCNTTNYSGGNCASSNGANGRPQYSNAGAGSCTECPAVTGSFASRATRYAYYPAVHKNGANGCYAYFNDDDPDATFQTICYYNATDGTYGGTHSNCQVYEPTWCSGGTYSTIKTTDEWVAAGSSNYAQCQGVDCLKGKVCTTTTAGSFSAEGSLTQTACATGSYSSAGAASCTACPGGKTTSGTGTAFNTDAATTCSTSCSNNANVQSTGWEKPSWSANSVSNLCTITITGCAANSYKNGNACPACSSLGYPSGYSTGTFSSATGSTANTACKFTGPAKDTPSNCDTITANTVTYTGSAWPTPTYKVTTVAGRYITANDVANPTCALADNKFYVDTVNATSQTQCPANYRGGSDGGRDDINDCYLTLTAGNFVEKEGQGAKTCTAGGYCASTANIYYGGTHSSTHMTTGGRTACAAGKANPNTGSTTASACASCTSGTYQDETGQTSCKSCPDAATHRRTTFNTTTWTKNGKSVTITYHGTPSIVGGGTSAVSSSGSTSITKCYLLEYIQTARGKIYESDRYNPTTGEYDTLYNLQGWIGAKPGYYLTGKDADLTSGCATYAYYSEIAECPAGSYCPGVTQSGNPRCDTDPTTNWTATKGIDSCVTGSYSAAGASACTACTNGKTTTGTGQTSCNADCSNNANVRAGTDGWTTTTWNTNNTMSNLCTIKSSGCAAANYKNGNACSACPAADAAHAMTSYPSAYHNVSERRYIGHSTAVGLQGQENCRVDYGLTNERGYFFVNAVLYNTTTGKYDRDVSSSRGYNSLNPGYYGSTKYFTDSTCNANSASNYTMRYKEAEPCPAGSYCPGMDSMPTCNSGTYNDTIGISVCATNTYSDALAGSCTACATANGYGNSGSTSASHAGVGSCKTTCGAGQYVATAGGACTNVGNTYWGAGGVVSQNQTLARNACPAGTKTYGSGNGADEAGDCGRILHVGDYSIYLRSDKKTTPSLNVKIGDDVYYGNMYQTGNGKTGHLHMQYSGKTYIVCDETGNACTGVQL